MMPHDLDRFYQQSDPAEPLPPHDPRYVSFEGLRGKGDLVTRMATQSAAPKTPCTCCSPGIAAAASPRNCFASKTSSPTRPTVTSHSSSSILRPTRRIWMSMM